MAQTALERIRNKTTSNTAVLSDALILALLDDNEQDWRLALADALEYLARDDVYESYSRGGISRGANVLRSEARYWRERAEREGGIQMDVVTRVDYEDEEGEYASA